MKIKFRPYLDIKDDKQLKLILNRQNSLEENYFNLSSIECSEQSFSEGVKRLKDFYGFTPKTDQYEFIEELVYHMLIVQYYYVFNFKKEITKLIDCTEDDIFFTESIEEALNKIDTDDNRDVFLNYASFFCNEIECINKFIVKYYGNDYLVLKEYSYHDLITLSFNEVENIENKIRCIIFTLANHTKFLRLRNLAFNISNYREDYSI